ncbi:MAG: ATP-grasp domain-containing protein [Verrucomicrobiota bacterium]
MNKGILLLSGGSKVAIAKIAKRSASKRGFVLHISDRSQNVPTRLIADQFALFPDQVPNNWVHTIADYAKAHNIQLIIPTRHTELSTLSQHREIIESAGARIALSSKKAIETCLDKRLTFEALSAGNIPTPATFSPSEFKPIESKSYIAKPRTGSSSQGLRFFVGAQTPDDIPENYIIQEAASEDEYTLNAYVDRQGQLISAIPHCRLILEGGESVQAVTRRIPILIETAETVISAIPGLFGPINIQAFYDDPGESCQVIEINPRLGGAYPLANQAKGEFIEWLCQETFENRALRPFDRWTENLLMMRYREAFFEVE